MFLREDLKLFELIVKKHSLRLGCNLSCHLISFDQHSSSLEQRKKLREQLIQEIEKLWPNKLSMEQKTFLLTPGNPPQIPFASVSLSHCAVIGGFIISPSFQASIGFDLEQFGRAKKKIVLRIANKNELNQSPSPSTLWSAKEAAYKSLYPFQPHTYIKKIFIFDWQSILYDYYNNQGVSVGMNKAPVEIYNYQFKIENKNIEGKGCVCILKNIVIGFAAL